MQEEIEKKTVALAISGSKITGRTLAKAISVYLNHRKGKLPDLKHGRQTIKDLMKHNTALAPSQQKWTQKSFKKRNESQYFVNLLKPTAFIPRFA